MAAIERLERQGQTLRTYISDVDKRQRQTIRQAKAATLERVSQQPRIEQRRRAQLDDAMMDVMQLFGAGDGSVGPRDAILRTVAAIRNQNGIVALSTAIGLDNPKCIVTRESLRYALLERLSAS